MSHVFHGPTLRTMLGLKSHRPSVGNQDGHSYVFIFGAFNLVTGHLTTGIVEHPQTAQKRLRAKHHYLPEGYARYLRAIAYVYLAIEASRVWW